LTRRDSLGDLLVQRMHPLAAGLAGSYRDAGTVNAFVVVDVFPEAVAARRVAARLPQGRARA
jgi:hypothetical protein